MKPEGEKTYKSRATSKIRMVFKVAAYSLYVLALLLVMEVLVRFYWNEPPATTLVGGNHPVYHHWPSYMTADKIGHMDMRKKEHSTEKTAGVKRIIFLGDSYTFGLGVPQGETIAHYLMKKLDHNYGHGKFEVLNYGMISFSPIIEETLYRNIVAQLKPDYVILQIDPFDSQEDHLYAELASFGPDGAALAVNGIPPEHGFFEKLALLRFLEFISATIHYGGDHVRPDLRMSLRSDLFYNPQKYGDWLDFTFSILKRLNERIKTDGAQMLLVTYPNPLYLINKDGYEEAVTFISNDFHKNKHESALPDIILQRCRDNGIDAVSLWGDFRKEELAPSPGRGSDLIFNTIDGHYTTWANKWVAGLLFNALRNRPGFENTPSPHQNSFD